MPSSRRDSTRGWLQASDDELDCVDYGFTPSPSHSPTSYRDALCRSPVQATALEESPQLGSLLDPEVEEPLAGGAVARGKQKHHHPSRHIRRRNPPLPLVAASPRAGDGQTLSRDLAARLGPVPPLTGVPPPLLMVTAPLRAGDGRPLSRDLAAHLGPVEPRADAPTRRRPRVDDDGF